jgi:hypothetical protein
MNFYKLFPFLKQNNSSTASHRNSAWSYSYDLKLWNLWEDLKNEDMKRVYTPSADSTTWSEDDFSSQGQSIIDRDDDFELCRSKEICKPAILEPPEWRFGFLTPRNSIGCTELEEPEKINQEKQVDKLKEDDTVEIKELRDVTRSLYERVNQLEEERDMKIIGIRNTHKKLKILQEELLKVEEASTGISCTKHQSKIGFIEPIQKRLTEKLSYTRRTDLEKGSPELLEISSCELEGENVDIITLSRDPKNDRYGEIVYLDDDVSSDSCSTEYPLFTRKTAKKSGGIKTPTTIKRNNSLDVQNTSILPDFRSNSPWLTTVNHVVHPKILDHSKIIASNTYEQPKVESSERELNVIHPDCKYDDGIGNIKVKTASSILRKVNSSEMKSPEMETTLESSFCGINKKGQSIIGPSHQQKLKVDTLNIIYKSYLYLLKSSQSSSNTRYNFREKFYVCFGALPRRTTLNPNDPRQIKDNVNRGLVSSIFWFRDKSKYEIFAKKTLGMPLQSREFQNIFSQLSLGTIFMSHESVVLLTNVQTIPQIPTTDKDLILCHLSCKNRNAAREFFVLPNSRDVQMFYKFCSDSKENKDKWILHIQRQLVIDKLHIETISNGINSSRGIRGEENRVSRSASSDISGLRRTSVDFRKHISFDAATDEDFTESWRKRRKKEEMILSSSKYLSVPGSRCRDRVSSLNRKAMRPQIERMRAHSLNIKKKRNEKGSLQFNNCREKSKHLKYKRSEKLIRGKWV